MDTKNIRARYSHGNTTSPLRLKLLNINQGATLPPVPIILCSQKFLEDILYTIKCRAIVDSLRVVLKVLHTDFGAHSEIPRTHSPPPFTSVLNHRFYCNLVDLAVQTSYYVSSLTACKLQWGNWHLDRLCNRGILFTRATPALLIKMAPVSAFCQSKKTVNR